MTTKTKEEINHVASFVASVGTEPIRELEQTIQQQREVISQFVDWFDDLETKREPKIVIEKARELLK